jgi:hypothetical protein
MICAKCKRENRDDYKFCAYCGTPRQVSPDISGSPNQPPSPVVEALREDLQASPADQIDPAPTASPAVKPKRKRRWWLSCSIIFIVLLCLAVVALVSVALFRPEWLPFDPPFLENNNNLIVGIPTEDGETDLYFLRQGKAVDQGLLLAESVTQANSALFYQSQDALVSLAGGAYPFGAFIPEQNYLLTWYTGADGDIILQRLELDQKDPFTLWQDNAASLAGYVLPNKQDLFFSIEQEPGLSCFLSTAGTAANQILSGDTCSLSIDFSTAFATINENDQTSFRLVTLPDMAEYTPLDGQELVHSADLSADGSRLVYTSPGEEPQVVWINSHDGNTLATGPDAYAIIEQGFASRGRIGYFIMENQDGNLELHLLSDSGASLIRTALSMAAAMDLHGAHLVYMVGEYEGERTLYVRDVSNGTDVELIRGAELRFELANPINRIFITAVQDGLTTLYSARMDGSQLVGLHTCQACQLWNIFYVPNQPYVFFELINDQGISLLAAQPEQTAQFMVVEGWASITLWDTSSDGRQLIFAGADIPNADSSLYLANLRGQEVITLDDDVDGIANALFDAQGEAVVYTALTGNKPDDVEIRRIKTDLSGPVEVLYSDTFLVAAQWDILQPLLTTESPSLLQSTSYCPGAILLETGEKLEGNLEAGSPDCYGFRGTAEETITFWVASASDLDTAIRLYDRQGHELDYDDVGFNGTDPRLTFKVPEGGIYFVKVSAFGDATGSYTLSSAAGSNYCPGVEILALGEEISGELADAGHQWYAFSGDANQNLTLWVKSTDLDPMLSLYDSQGFVLSSDDDSRDGVDPLLSTTLPEDGYYCLEVGSFGSETGPFTLAAVEGTVFCPGADTLTLDETVSGSVDGGRRACYAIGLSANTTFSFVTNSLTGTDTVLELYDSNGFMLDSDDDSAGNLSPLLVFNSERSDTYYIVIRGFNTDSTGEYQLTFSEGFGFCSDPQTIQLGDAINGYLEAYQTVCYIFEGAERQNIQINIDSTVDTTLTLYADDGSQVAFNDDTVGLNPQLRVTLPQDGTYYVALRGYFEAAGSFTLTFDAGPEFANPFLNAVQLPAGQRIQGTITIADAVYVPNGTYEGYGDMYYFDGSEGQTIQIDAFADSLGSDLDSWLLLFDEETVTQLADNDDSGSTLDSQITLKLPYTGRYYILIVDAFGGYGSANEYFYELLLSVP